MSFQAMLIALRKIVAANDASDVQFRAWETSGMTSVFRVGQVVQPLWHYSWRLRI
jgi:hypothetical protein